MNALEEIRGFIEKFPGHEKMKRFHLDYTDKVPWNGGAFPDGLVEISRKRDILGGCKVTNQLNFGLYYVFPKDPGDDDGAAENAEWIADFQEWVQEQSIRRLAPTFGDVPWREVIRAQNGQLYQADEEGTAMYMVQLSVQYEKYYTGG